MSTNNFIINSNNSNNNSKNNSNNNDNHQTTIAIISSIKVNLTLTLPTSVLAYCFSWFGIHNKTINKNCEFLFLRTVCKTWNELIKNCKSAWSNQKLKVNFRRKSVRNAFGFKSGQADRKQNNTMNENIDYSWFSSNFKYLPNLHFHDLHVIERNQHYSHNSLIFKQFLNLTHLTKLKVSHLTKKVHLIELLKLGETTFQGLKHLAIKGDPSRLIPANNINSIFSFKHLEILRITGFQLIPQFVKQCISKSDSKLKELKYFSLSVTDYCDYNWDIGLTPTIRLLEFTSCTQLQQISETVPFFHDKLLGLNVSNCVNSEKLCQAIPQAKNLLYLIMPRFYNGKAIFESITRNCKQLQALDLQEFSDGESIDWTSIHNIGSTLRYLQFGLNDLNRSLIPKVFDIISKPCMISLEAISYTCWLSSNELCTSLLKLKQLPKFKNWFGKTTENIPVYLQNLWLNSIKNDNWSQYYNNPEKQKEFIHWIEETIKDCRQTTKDEWNIRKFITARLAQNIPSDNE